MSRQITVPLEHGPRPGMVQAVVQPGPDLDGPSLEKFAHEFLARLPDEPGLAPAGLQLLESGLAPPETGPWITVWGASGPGMEVVPDESATFTFTYDADAEDTASLKTQTIKEPNMAAATTPTEQTFDERDKELADALQTLEAGRKATTNPALLDRYDSAIKHFRRQSAKLHHPDQAEEITKSEIADLAVTSPGYRQALQKAETLRKAEQSLSRLAAMERAMRDPAIAAQYAREQGIAA